MGVIKEFNFKDSMNMVIAVSGTYVTRQEVMDYFNKNFSKDKAFNADELKQIVRELTTDKKRITSRMDENYWNPNSIPNKRGRPKKDDYER